MLACYDFMIHLRILINTCL